MYSPIVTQISLPQVYIQTAEMGLNHNWTFGGPEQNFFNAPQDLLELLATDARVLSQYSDIGQCSAGGGAGAPTVHIPVAELTISTQRTIAARGTFPNNPQTGGRSSIESTGSHVDGDSYSNGKVTSHSRSPSDGNMITTSRVQTLGSGVTHVATAGQPVSNDQPPLTTFASAEPTLVAWQGSTSHPESNQNIGQHPPNSWSMRPEDSMGGSQADKGASIAAMVMYDAAGSASSQIAAPSKVPTPDQSSTFVVDGSTMIPGMTEQAAPEIMHGGQILPMKSLADGAVAVGGQTLYPGGAPVMTAGKTLSLDRSGAMLVDGSNFLLPTITGPSSAIMVGSQVLPMYALPASALVVRGQTLYPGGPPITINVQGHHETLSLAAGVARGEDGKRLLEIDGHTYTLSSDASFAVAPDGATVSFLTISGSEIILGSQTLVPGGAPVTIGGLIFRENLNGELVQMTTSATGTVELSDSRENNIAKHIMSGLGVTGQASERPSKSTSALTPQTYTGAAMRQGSGRRAGAQLFAVGLEVLIIALLC